ncbi:hypothetical protein [Streptomyces cavernae]|uniref:hypothetical protein n=1 Tax=Streptomyces cavernae TaxID=2259034 RepID=UPI000FEBD688|nr:hypothetical protein [Streptomyces cavernae]
MMRLPRLLIAGILLSVTVFLLSALFAQPASRSVGAASAAVFVPLWYCLTAVHAGLGMAYGIRGADEIVVFGTTFSLPTTASLVMWWVSASEWEGGPVLTTGRTPVMLTAGMVLWAAVALLVAVLAPGAADGAGSWAAAAAAAFLPLWLLVCGANALLGVFAAGYTWREELFIMVANLSLPTVVALLAPWAISRRRHEEDVAGYGAESRETTA